MASIRMLCHLSCLLAGLAVARQEAPAPPPSPIAAFVAGQTVGERSAAASRILASGATFDQVFTALRRGRTYSSDVPRGLLLREHEINGVRHPYMILVPEDYSPEERLPVRVDLHGGMGAKEWKQLDGSWSPGWRPLSGRVVIVPAGWWDSMWWEANQVENLEAILREVRATWNIDENRVVLTGTSDGGAALFFQAMRTPDRWAGYLGFVAPPDRLLRKELRPDGQMHVSNVFGQRLALGYGERDRQVPLRYIERYMQLFERAGARLDWYVLKRQGHNLKLPDERMQQYARDPLPDDISWATEDPSRYGRRSWLVIDELGKQTEVGKDEILPRLGTRLRLQGPTTRRMPWGKVKLHREGNLVRAEVANVARFTLLVSPDEFDLDQPIRVEVGAELQFDQLVEPSVATLLELAAVDDDRTRLFAAAIEIELDLED